jgi:hypothetical protein
MLDCAQVDHNIGFKKTDIFLSKWVKTAVNCDHNIETRDCIAGEVWPTYRQ